MAAQTSPRKDEIIQIFTLALSGECFQVNVLVKGLKYDPREDVSEPNREYLSTREHSPDNARVNI